MVITLRSATLRFQAREYGHTYVENRINTGSVTPYKAVQNASGALLQNTKVPKRSRTHSVVCHLDNCTPFGFEGGAIIVDAKNFLSWLRTNLGEVVTIDLDEDDGIASSNQITGVITSAFEPITNIRDHWSTITIQLLEVL